MVDRLGLRIAYDGSQFSGFQRQPGKRTIEGDILSALKKIGAIKDAISSNYRCSSRTDAGVSAIGNIISIDTSFPRSRLKPALNSKLEDIWCTGITLLPKDFNPRHAQSREYWYYLLSDGHDLTNMKKCTEKFVGTHDFSKYSRADGRNSVRRIIRFEIALDKSLIIFKITGESFLWNQVRRMVWAIDQVGRGKADPDLISPDEYKLKRIGLAPAENLILASVNIGIIFDQGDDENKSTRDIRDKLVGASVRREVLRRVYNDLSNRQIE